MEAAPNSELHRAQHTSWQNQIMPGATGLSHGKTGNYGKTTLFPMSGYLTKNKAGNFCIQPYNLCCCHFFLKRTFCFVGIKFVLYCFIYISISLTMAYSKYLMKSNQNISKLGWKTQEKKRHILLPREKSSSAQAVAQVQYARCGSGDKQMNLWVLATSWASLSSSSAVPAMYRKEGGSLECVATVGWKPP